MKKGIFSILLLLFLNTSIAAQSKNQFVRLVKITVDSAQLTQYNAALTLQMNTAMQLETGVLTYYAMANKNNASEISILEIYASKQAYEKHITTAHFKQYKATVKNMVTSLELIDVNLIGVAKKANL